MTCRGEKRIFISAAALVAAVLCSSLAFFAAVPVFAAQPVPRERTDSSDVRLLIEKRKYRSDFSVRPKDGAYEVTIFNGRDATRLVLPNTPFLAEGDGEWLLLEKMSLGEYIECVLAAEFTSDDGSLLAAAAILVRTLACREMSARCGAPPARHRASDPFLLCARTHCASFRGLPPPSRRERISAAVAGTSGQVLLFNGSPAEVYFSACCGGVSHNVSDVFAGGADLPYLARKKCPCGGARKWTGSYSAGDVRRIFGVRVGTIEKMENPPGVFADGVPVPFDALMRRMERTGLPRLKSPDFSVERTAGGGFALRGRGLGHGIGFCDAGAAIQAASGAGRSAILKFYYPGCVIGIYSPPFPARRAPK